MTGRIKFLILIALAVMFSSCNFPLFKGEEQGDTGALATAVQQTVQAMNLQSQAATISPQQAAAQSGQPTVTLQPSAALSTPTAETKPCNKAKLVSETFPDDSQFFAGDKFTKTWTLKNVGTCSWNTNYRLVFVDGDAMGGTASANLAQGVLTDGQITLEVDLEAPAAAGTYFGSWGLKGEDDKVFTNFTVRIIVKEAPFQVSSVTFDMDDSTPTIDCPGTVNVDAIITATATGKVTYYWTNNEGGTSSTKTIKFTEAGSEVVDYDMPISGEGRNWVKLYIDNPNHQLFGPKKFKVTCNP
jgi:hypothetical protein